MDAKETESYKGIKMLILKMLILKMLIKMQESIETAK